MAVNHLKNVEAQGKFLTVSFGLHDIAGHLCWSKSDGGNIYGYNALGEGQWNACRGAFYRGIEILPADYNFHAGALATAMATGPQIVDSFFPLDVPHTRTAAMGFRIPLSLGDADTEANPPDKFRGIFETKLCPDFNSSGVQTDFSYTANPAREIVELLRTYCRLPNLPSAYSSAAAYWLSRIDWSAWCDWRDYCAANETVDYTTIPDFDGFGLSAEFYNGTNFDTLIAKRVQPTLNFALGTAKQAVGLTPGSFSARFEGFIKADYSETYTFSITHDNGVRLWMTTVAGTYGTALIDQWNTSGTSTPGTHTATYTMTAGTFYKLKVEWNDGGGSSQLQLNWSSTSQASGVVSSKNLYPKVESRPRYESHVFFETPTSPADAINTILLVSNSLKQDVNGKLRFFCLEQLSPSFTFDGSNIIEGTFNFSRSDILQSNPVTEYRAQMRRLDSRYLEEPPTPPSYKPAWLTRKEIENVKIIPLFNMTDWQALKVLAMRAKLEVDKDLLNEFECDEAKSYPVLAGDVVTINHRKIGTTKNYLIREATDRADNVSRGSAAEPARRYFKAQEWS